MGPVDIGPELIGWRLLLFVEATATVVMYGALLGHYWRRLNWPLRIAAIGLGGVLVYVATGQVKAYNLGVPVDAISAIGLVFYAATIIGMLAVRHKERSSLRGH